ncbi:unnamed protein product [Chrysoparadoxa australica]
MAKSKRKAAVAHPAVKKALKKTVKALNGSLDSVTTNKGGRLKEELRYGRVLVAEADLEHATPAIEILEEAGYMVTVEADGRHVVDTLIEQDFDAILLAIDLPLANGFTITKTVRDQEKTKRMKSAKRRADAIKLAEANGQPLPSALPDPRELVPLPVIAFTEKASPDDLRMYMQAGMDGCVSKPVDEGALLNTMRAAIPFHLTKLELDEDENENELGRSRGGAMVSTKGGAMGVLKGSSACAAEGLATSSMAHPGGAVFGALQVDADTSVPYCVVDIPPPKGPPPFFNLVVCHDIFDTYERMKIFLQPIFARYPGAQVLLWNYPGQAYSEWREEQLLNNEYLASLLQHLLLHLGQDGTGEFDSSRPFYLMGFGSGGSVATFYASHYTSLSMRALVLFNSFSHVDAYLAGILHDCMNVFGCAPETRPDLPVYFHARFLFSPSYLAQVSTPLALNIYTAVHNPITVRGRVQLCFGALSHVDTRAVLGEIDVPTICIQSTQNNLVKPLHTDPYVTRRGGETRSIHQSLLDPSKTCVMWVNAGHELFQEAKSQVTMLLEQLVSGYHEKNDVVYTMSSQEVGPTGDGDGRPGTGSSKPMCAVAAAAAAGAAGVAKPVATEDSYIDNVLGTMGEIQAEGNHKALGASLRSEGQVSLKGKVNLPFLCNYISKLKPHTQGDDHGLMQSTWDGNMGEVFGEGWEEYRTGVTTGYSIAMSASSSLKGRTNGRCQRMLDESDEDLNATAGTGRGRQQLHKQTNPMEGIKGSKVMVGSILDAAHPAFERQDSLVYGFGAGSKIYPQPAEFPEVREYMTWRLKRNKKRLHRLDQAARKIQGVMRTYRAYKMVQGMREERAVIYLQRIYRGWRGRLQFLAELRVIWAAQIVQRNWRGMAGRRWFQLMRVQCAACGHIQRVWRGAIARRYVKRLCRGRNRGATKMQAMMRGVWGRRAAFRLRLETLAARTVQRAFRGYIGRRRADRERDKYLFSKSQSQGIEFGRQMLLEHKLHATRLQSEVQLLTQEKVEAEEAVEATMEEISEFEEGVTILEKEMHQLSKIETEAAGVLDEEARFELREQKIRLDKEFGVMLGKIADRKDRLQHMEKKLSTLDRLRLGKEEELRTLERKLVVLLEEQQRELENIRQRQERKGKLLLDGESQNSGVGGMAGGGGGGYSGPSARDKRQAAQLMQSTETLMKFGFMSMSMTYFSSLNMIRAMRTVGASDTIMAAVTSNAAKQDMQTGSSGGGDKAQAMADNEKLGAQPFQPSFKAGELPGSQTLRVSAWSVDDVARWLQTLSLPQYQEAFIDAAVDGAFLYDLNNDDLKNTLGVEHRLHRKKLINSIERLKRAELERDRQLTLAYVVNGQRADGGVGGDSLSPGAANDEGGFGAAAEALGTTVNPDVARGADGEPVARPPLDFKECLHLTRHGKYKKLKEILEQLPNRLFEKSLVRVQYVADIGTSYQEGYEKEPFNMNKTDEHGNTLLMIASQNGNLKVSKLFIQKGANPNHQNKQGQTAGHYATAYQFFELVGWLFDPAEVGADDTLENKFGLGPYDGLHLDGEAPALLEG